MGALTATDTEPPPPDAAATELVDAWRRTRTATYRAEGTVVREGRAGGRLETPTLYVQRPPRRLFRQGGTVRGVDGGQAFRCPPAPGGGAASCVTEGPVVAYDDRVEAEVAAVAELVVGPAAHYEVRPTVDGCWRLEARHHDPRARFGDRALICVDAASGALSSLRLEFTTAVETTTHDRIDTAVDDDDLRP